MCQYVNRINDVVLEQLIAQNGMEEKKKSIWISITLM